MHRPMQVGSMVIASRAQATAAGLPKRHPTRMYGAGVADDYYRQQHPVTPDRPSTAPQSPDRDRTHPSRASSAPPSRPGRSQPRRGVLAKDLGLAQAAAARLSSPPSHLVRCPPKPDSMGSRHSNLWMEASHHSGTAQHPANPMVRSFNRYQSATRAATTADMHSRPPPRVRAVAAARRHAAQGRLDAQRPAAIGPWNAAAQPRDNITAYNQAHVIYALVPHNPTDGDYVGLTSNPGGAWERHRRRREDKAFGARPDSELSAFEAHLRAQGETSALHEWTLMPLEVVPLLQGAQLERWRAQRLRAQRLRDVTHVCVDSCDDIEYIETNKQNLGEPAQL